jgi:hypothetical protein
MRRILALALAVGILGLADIAQAADHNMGLEFGFSGLSNLGVSPVQAGSIGVKKLMSPDNYVLARFGFGISSDTNEASDDDFTDAKDGTTTVGVGLGLQHYMPVCDGLAPYVGGLFQVGYTSATEEPSTADPAPAGTMTKETTTTMMFGVVAMAGVEWFFKPCLSLSGEYTFGFSYNSTKREWEYQGNPSIEDKSHGLDIGPFSAAGVRLTAYWD